jgi:hypothetical protein
MAKKPVTNEFDSAAYLLANPDVAAAGMDALTHYNQYGRTEGRTWGEAPMPMPKPFAYEDTSSPMPMPKPYMYEVPSEFDSTAYLAANPDVAAAGMDAAAHYNQYGRLEGRTWDTPAPAPTVEQALQSTFWDGGGQATPDNQNIYAWFAEGGEVGAPRYLDGESNGQADEIAATIEGSEPARLSHGEFVIPADIVAALGAGNSKAGAQTLYDMMDRIRTQAYGHNKQMRPVDPKTLPA